MYLIKELAGIVGSDYICDEPVASSRYLFAPT